MHGFPDALQEGVLCLVFCLGLVVTFLDENWRQKSGDQDKPGNKPTTGSYGINDIGFSGRRIGKPMAGRQHGKHPSAHQTREFAAESHPAGEACALIVIGSQFQLQPELRHGPRAETGKKDHSDNNQIEGLFSFSHSCGDAPDERENGCG